MDKEWDNNNLNYYINDCINIENNIKDINKINENINKYNTNNKIKIKFYSKGNQLNKFIETIKSFGKIGQNRYSFRECPLNIKVGRKYVITGDNKNILTKSESSGVWMGTICKNELDKSVEDHKWKIKILKTNCNAIMVGVAPNNFDINSSDYTCGWYFNCYNSELYSGPPYNYSNLETNLSNVIDEIIVEGKILKIFNKW